MEERLISFETAKLAKEKGFNSITPEALKAASDTRNYETVYFDFYMNSPDGVKLYHCGTNSNNFFGLKADYLGKIPPESDYKWYLAPTQPILQKWLREHEQNIQVYVKSGTVNGDNKWRDYVAYIDGIEINDSRDEEFQTYEDALEYGLFTALTKIKK